MPSASSALYFLSEHHNATHYRAQIARLSPPSGFERRLYEAWVEADFSNHRALESAYKSAGLVFRAWRRGGIEEAWRHYESDQKRLQEFRDSVKAQAELED